MDDSVSGHIHAVIARYSEDVSWANDLKFSYTIYNKGKDTIPGSKTLDNIGREAHTYFTHIVLNYNSLQDFTVFLQGNPFPHMQETADVHVLNKLVIENAGKQRAFTPFAWFRLACDQLGRPHDMNDPAKKGRWAGYGKDIPVGKVFEKLFHHPAPQKFIATAPTGLFMVSRDRILCRPIGFYQAALKLILKDPDDTDNTGHAFERLWNTIFNGNKRLNAFYDK